MIEDNLISIKEATKILGVSLVTLRNWDNQNILKAIRIGSRNDRRYKKSIILDFLNRSESESNFVWQEYIRNGFIYYFLEPVARGMTKEMRKNFGDGINFLMANFKNDVLYWHYNPKDLYELGALITDKLINSEKFFNNIFLLWQQRQQDILTLIEKNNPSILKKISTQNLAKLIKHQADLVASYYGIVSLIDCTDESLTIDISQEIKDFLSKKLGNNYNQKKFVEIYNVLTMPTDFSYVSRERLLTLELAQNIKNKKLKFTDKFVKEKVNDIVKDFWWINLGFGRGKKKTEENVIDDVKKIILSKIDLKKEIEIIKNYNDDVKTKILNLDLSSEILENKKLVDYLILFRKLSEYHDRRKEVQVKTAFWSYQLLDEIAIRTKMPVSILEWYSPEEVIKLLKGEKVDESIISQRSFCSLYIYIKGHESQFSGRGADKEYNRILGQDNEEVRDLQGITASLGLVTGRAFVAITPSHAAEIKEGEILITGMTTPEYVPAMKKAGAIITDEGGITCHAAIISRELNIPCIVGTKYATKTIKSGDLLEIKANHGVVRILESKN